MNPLYISAGQNTPEIKFLPEEDLYIITGNSAPEDVRALYYPVIDWFSKFSAEIKSNPGYFSGRQIVLRIDLKYFNSASAKFLYDIIMELRNITGTGIPVAVKWYYDKDDSDMMEAGKDISNIVEMEFEYIENEDK